MALTESALALIQSKPEEAYLTARHLLDNQTENLTDEEEENLLTAQQLALSYLPADYNVSLMNSISAEAKSAIDNAPDKVYLNARNALNDADLSTDDLKTVYAYQAYAANSLKQKGEDPQDLLKPDSVGQKTLDITFDILNSVTTFPAKVVASLPTNAKQREGSGWDKFYTASRKLPAVSSLVTRGLANLYDYGSSFGTPRDSDPTTGWGEEFLNNWKNSNIKVVDGEGWSDLLTQEFIGDSDTVYSNILEKVAAGDALTDDEEEIYKSVNQTIFWLGLFGDLALDPLNAVTAGAKALRAGETAKDATKIIDTMKSANAFDDTIQAARQLGKYASQVADSDEVVKFADKMMNLDNISDLYKFPPLYKLPDNYKYTLEFTDDFAKFANRSDDLGEGLRSLIKNDLKKIAVLESPFAKSALGYSFRKGAQQAVETVKESMPGLTQSLSKVRKIVSDQAAKFKNFFDNSRAVENSMKNYGRGLADQVMISTSKLSKTLYGGLDEAHRIVDELVERPDTIPQVIAKGKNTAESVIAKAREIADGIRKASQDIFVDSVAVAGSDVFPMGLLDGLDDVTAEVYRNKWIDIADSFKSAYLKNPMSTETQRLANIVRQYGASESGYLAKELMGSTEGGLNYFAHVVSEDAADFLRGLSGSMASKSKRMGDAFDPSWLQRSMKNLSIKEINDVVKSGDPDAIRKIFSHDTAENVIDFTKAYPNKPFFSEDPADIIRIRANRAGRVMTQATLKNQFVDFMKNFDTEDYYFKFEPKQGYTYSEELSKVFGNGKVTQKIYVENELFREMNNWGELQKPYFNNEVMQNALHIWDKANSILRKSFLVPFPTYHFRNEVGNMYALALGGAMNPADLFTAKKLMSWGENSKGLDKLKNFKIKATNGAIYTGEDIMNYARKTDVYGTTRNMIENQLGGRVGANIQRGFAKMREAGEGATKVGQAVSKAGKVVEGATDVLASPMAALGNYLENHARLTMFINKLRNGQTVLDAANTTKKYLFDYSDLSRFESQVVKRVAFFYTWARKNLFLQLGNITSKVNRNILKTVGDINQAGGLQGAITGEPSPIVDERYQSDYLANIPTLLINRQPTGRKSSHWSLVNFVPSMDIFEPIINMQKRDGVGATFRGLAQSLTPLLRVPIERGANKSFFNDSAIEDYPGEKTQFLGMQMPAKTAYTIKNFSRLLSLLNTVLSQNERLSPFGVARTSPAMDTGLKIMKVALGTPLQYESDFSRIFSASDAGDLAYEKLGSIYSDAIRLQQNYTGDEFPLKNVKTMVEDLREVNQFITEKAEYGNISNEDQLVNYTEKVAEMIGEIIEAYGLTADEFLEMME